MKRFLTSLTIVSLLGFAAPALAAPKVLSKKRLSVPVLSQKLLQSYFGQTAWRYQFLSTTSSASGYGEMKSPPYRTEIIQEKVCGNTTYRFWDIKMDEDLVSKKVGKTVKSMGDRVGVVQAMQNTRTYSMPWQEFAYRTDCFGDRVRAMATGGKIYLISASDIKAGKMKTPVKLSLDASLNGAVMVDGIVQFPGTISRQAYTSQAIGDSTIFALEKDGSVTAHHPTFFKNYNTTSVADLKPSFLNVSGTLVGAIATFYRLHDGYGVSEFYEFDPDAYQPLDPICTEGVTCYGHETPDFRIRNGEARYSMFPPFHATEPPRGYGIAADGWNGIVLLQNAPFNLKEMAYLSADKAVTKSLLHGVPLTTVTHVSSDQSPGTIALGASDVRVALDPKKPSGGSVVRETADKVYVRYYVTPYGGETQYWEAVVQK